ncbi:MAG: xylulokinase [Candidatus Jordarchaeales archaeon]
MEYLVAIDAGTIGCRTIVFDENGREIGRAYEEYPSLYPYPTWVEQRPDDWWRAVCNTVKGAISRAKIKAEEIAGISVTNQRETIVPVDENGKPLRNAIVWQDRRTIEECRKIKEVLGSEKVYEITGLTVDPYFSAPKILWIKENEKEIFDKTYKFMLVHDYILMKLTGEFVTDWSNASRTMLFNIKEFKWSREICDALEIPLEKLPRAEAPAKKIGEVTREASEATGLAVGTPVVTGGGDQQCGAVGIGVVREGRVKATTGTGTFILAYSGKPVLDKKMRVLCSCHADPGKWVVEASIFTTGSIYRWFRDQLGHVEKVVAEILGEDPYNILNKEAEAVPPGSGGILVLPHFIGAGAPYWNPNSRGVIFGLALGHTRKHLIRALMEGVCFEIRKNIEVMREVGISINEMRITGGATRSDLWNQIQADIYNLPIVIGAVEEATALGAAILAGVGVGVYKSISEAAERAVKIKEVKKPDATKRKVYDSLYSLHVELYEALNSRGLFEKLAKVAELM